ncbi:aminotransferase class I/II-fold pyridoxal phosphate-dependent enzyme [Actinosynnema pretiosum]|uniref:3-amino-5-hydroxybenzoic acid synthase n=2 Tax=Actinosynnema pretiosum TaxID=42197 RepID=A0A290Z6I8_9PSEU|nr:aminotransferase class I/II-fold pyridoxal phosphate-dependent enzyme [Actinosynnema pretiosum]AAM54102.1 3-amino-5-hydroxybenzoate synthase [Actinosynnema pretiosum subsp. auranticum]ATE54647.1 3-amino-5-hydroxybenzoic acid synthase [Actinosynnema pretiosum]
MHLKAPQKLEFPAWPQFDSTEREALLRTLDSGRWWRITGDEVVSFEREFAQAHGARHALAVTTGTHALELVLEVMGAGPGTEVIVPAFTFISSSQAAQRLGAVVVPVDVDPDTYCVDPAAVRAAITERTRAIMPVHMAGQLADMDALRALSAETGVPLLQDAAHAHGARWRGEPLGALGSIAAFSFQNGKLMTAGEGGAVLLPDGDQHEEAFLRHACGRPLADRAYHHRTAGSNFRMNEFSAALLRAQLGRLQQQTDVRERHWPVLSRLLAEVPGVVPQGTDPRCDRNPHYMAMFQVPGIGEERRARLVDALVERGVPAFAGFRAIYRTAAFWERAAPDTTVDALARACPVTEALSSDCVWLHHRVLLGAEEQMPLVAEAVACALEEA